MSNQLCSPCSLSEIFLLAEGLQLCLCILVLPMLCGCSKLLTICPETDLESSNTNDYKAILKFSTSLTPLDKLGSRENYTYSDYVASMSVWEKF